MNFRCSTRRPDSTSGGFQSVRQAVAIATVAAMAMSPNGLGARDLSELSIEELLNESVTSVSKREQKLGDVASAITVLSNDDLRRSGVTTIADALRLVPGVHVGAVNASQWAISARGFTNLYANKLLVLVDGRAVYTPLWGGVYWDMQQPVLEDVDRVEVIRGPGATVWGANAVNGVINIVSRSARDTQGTLVFGGLGSSVEELAGVRHGGQAGDKTYYRIFAQREVMDDFPLPDGTPAGDAWSRWTTGFRIDHYPESATRFTWQGDVTTSDLDHDTSDGRTANTLARWTRQLDERSSIEAQAYFDMTTRHDITRSDAKMQTFDVTLEHTFGIGERNDVIWGVGYRAIKGEIGQTNPVVTVSNPAFDLELFSAFVQDEFQILPEKLTLTAGVKVEDNDFTGAELQPSVRAVWKPTHTQTIWAALSRAVRTPSALEDKNLFMLPYGAPMPGPDGQLYTPTLTGNGNPRVEVLWSHEAGWRVQPREFVSFDFSSFYNHYESLIAPLALARFVPGVPFGVAEMPFMSSPGLDTYGAEFSVTIAPTSSWRLTGSYSILHNHAPELPSTDPENMAVLRSSHEFGRVGLDVQMRYVSGFAYPMTPELGGVPTYVEADVRLSYRPKPGVELSLVGQNLLDSQHPEQGPTFYSVTAEVPRRIFGKVTWSF